MTITTKFQDTEKTKMTRTITWTQSDLKCFTAGLQNEVAYVSQRWESSLT
ncbi:hypothetical protein HYC85_029474 [Camellia sinensis]|uniref:Uncharacterized protein n=1 Tax=Camellia sinensis TaxID=4442 RepID=A0A7J7FY23_CAMSI|nr:hypothetical protein HYC85_029474 [Camellia sinensis]